MSLKTNILLDNIDLFVELFYDHFFEQTFEITHLFRNTEIGKQKNEFKESILILIKNGNNLEPIAPALEDLGVRHICYEVTDRHYELATLSFIYALEKTYDKEWSDQLYYDWLLLFEMVIKHMKDGVQKVEQAS
jgi:hemoglobin-like flavoprotein